MRLGLHIEDVVGEPDKFAEAGRNHGFDRRFSLSIYRRLQLGEAMMAGKAVIGSDIGGISTIIKDGENGLLFEPNNEQEYVAAIRKLLDNKELKTRLEENARVYSRETYSSKAMYTKFKQLYETLS